MQFNIVTITLSILLCGTSIVLQAEENPCPIAFKFHGVRRAHVKAMGFSPDGKKLAIWRRGDLIFVDTKSGNELSRIRTKGGSLRCYNFVTFDPSGKYCCLADNGKPMTIQFFDIANGRASEKMLLEKSPDYRYYYDDLNWYLPLREWLNFRVADDSADATVTALFPGDDRQAEKQVAVQLGFDGNDRIKEADRIYKAMDEKSMFKLVRKSGGTRGPDLQVALSNDRKMLLTQFQRSSGNTAQAWYRFHFYDVATHKQITEIWFSTGIFWRSHVSRGFAFSPDFSKLARSIAGGTVIVHDITPLTKGKVDAPTSYVIPFN